MREPTGIRRHTCSACPFTIAPTAIDPELLGAERRANIVDSLRAGETFACHKEAHDQLPTGPAGPRQCTGAAVVMARGGEPNIVMRLAVALREPPFVDPGYALIPWHTLDEWYMGWEHEQAR